MEAVIAIRVVKLIHKIRERIFQMTVERPLLMMDQLQEMTKPRIMTHLRQENLLKVEIKRRVETLPNLGTKHRPVIRHRLETRINLVTLPKLAINPLLVIKPRTQTQRNQAVTPHPKTSIRPTLAT